MIGCRSFYLVALLLLGLSNKTLQLSTPESKTYWGAVVEFSSEPYTQLSSARVEKATRAYVELIESDEASRADIIVFPESTLNSIHQAMIIPEPADRIAPCDNESYAESLRNISCSARLTQKYIVINLTEKIEGETEEDPSLYCNSNAVFDREGRVISRYRKFNLFGEHGISVTTTPDISYFETDFNVTFGHFICFDLLFKTPALELMRNEFITDIVYPTMWFSELPFLTSVQAQSMWSHKQQVNFLAAGASNPRVGSTGSGIYSKKGAIKSIMSGNAERKLYVAEIPKKQFWDDEEVQNSFSHVPNDGPTALEQFIHIKRDNIDVYSAKYLDFTSSITDTIKEKLCYDGLCCNFEVSVTKTTVEKNAKSFKHFVVAFDGVRSYDGFATGGTFTCALISCLNSTLASCGLRFDTIAIVENDYIFDSIKIEGNFRKTENTLAMANTLDHQLNALPFNDYTYEEKEVSPNQTKISMKLFVPSATVYTFGIYGRDFATDGMEPNSANSVPLFKFLIAILCIILVV